MKVGFEVSKKGIPCLWEKGGSYTNTGSVQLIADMFGQRKKALFVRRGGQLACQEHALIPVRVGDMVVQASHHRGEFDINLYQIQSVDVENKTLNLELINAYGRGEWDSDLLPQYQNLIEATMAKVKDYHCRSVYYASENTNEVTTYGATYSSVSAR